MVAEEKSIMGLVYDVFDVFGGQFFHLGGGSCVGAENFTSGGEWEFVRPIRNVSAAKSRQVLEVGPRISPSGYFRCRKLCGRYSPPTRWGMLLLFLEGNARKWLISSWGPDGSRRPRDWLEFKSQLTNAFAEKRRGGMASNAPN